MVESNSIIIVPSCIFGLLAGYINFMRIKKVTVEAVQGNGDKLLADNEARAKAPGIYEKIMHGALTFCGTEYKIATVFCLGFALAISCSSAWALPIGLRP